MNKALTLSTCVFMFVMNTLANTLPLNGKNTGELSDLYPNLFVPAGFTFSIWAVIYTLVIISMVRLILKKENFSFWVPLNFLANGLWIVAWHYLQIELSLIIMLFLLFTLIKINFEVKGFSKLTFGIYLGWICVATVANATALLVAYDFNAILTPENWTTLLIIIASIIACFTAFKTNNLAVLMAVLWAFYGINAKRHNATDQYPQIYIGLIAASLVILSFMIAYRKPLFNSLKA